MLTRFFICCSFTLLYFDLFRNFRLFFGLCFWRFWFCNFFVILSRIDDSLKPFYLFGSVVLFKSSSSFCKFFFEAFSQMGWNSHNQCIIFIREQAITRKSWWSVLEFIPAFASIFCFNFKSSPKERFIGPSMLWSLQGEKKKFPLSLCFITL